MDIDAAVGVLEVGLHQTPILLLSRSIPKLHLVSGTSEGHGFEHVIDSYRGLHIQGGTFCLSSN